MGGAQVPFGERRGRCPPAPAGWGGAGGSCRRASPCAGWQPGIIRAVSTMIGGETMPPSMKNAEPPEGNSAFFPSRPLVRRAALAWPATAGACRDRNVWKAAARLAFPSAPLPEARISRLHPPGRSAPMSPERIVTRFRPSRPLLHPPRFLRVTSTVAFQPFRFRRTSRSSGFISVPRAPQI